MERIPIPPKTDNELNNVLVAMMDGALGNPQVLENSPTTAIGELKENNFGFDGSNLFITLQGTIYKINLTEV